MHDLHYLYETYARDVHRFVLYLSGDPALAEDVTSETFLRAWCSAAPIRTATVKSYLLTIARNTYLESRRRSSRHVPLDETTPATDPSPEERAEQRNLLEVVLRALRGLPELDRAA